MPQRIIKLSNLVFSWPGQTQATLDIHHLDIQPGEKLFIQGPSGSGKTSLLNLIGAVTAPTSGSIHVLDQNLGELKGSSRDQFRADHVGFIFQQFNLVPYLSMIENILLPCHFSLIRKRRAAAEVNLVDQAMKLLSHLRLNDPALHKKSVTELSVGQQQRVAAARAVIGSPEIIIADEPTSALDEDSREFFVKLLFRECNESGSTLVFVSHDRSLGRFFDRRINLANINSVSLPDTVASRL